MTRYSLLLLLLIAATICVAVEAAPPTSRQSDSTQHPERYDGYRLVEVGPLVHDSDVKLIQKLSSDRRKVINFKAGGAAIGRKVALLVSPTELSALTAELTQRELNYQVVMENYQDCINTVDRRNAEAAERASSRSTVSDHTFYRTYAEQQAYLSTMIGECDFCDYYKLPQKTAEGRDINVFTINDGDLSKPAVWIDANMEACQWISSATALYLIDQIVNNNSDKVVYLRNNFRFYIASNINPDGYEYSRLHVRTWFKNRSVHGSCNEGVLLSRNFAVGFGGAGTNTNCSADNYPGPNAFSEAETVAMRDYINGIDGLWIYLSLHSYEQQLLLPWWYTASQTEDYSELRRVAELAILQVNNTNNQTYRVGTPSELLVAPASGTPLDWAKLDAGIPYSYHLTLRPADAGQGAYCIDASYIIPSGQEILNGLTKICEEAIIHRTTLAGISTEAPTTKVSESMTSADHVTEDVTTAPTKPTITKQPVTLPTVVVPTYET